MPSAWRGTAGDGFDPGVNWATVQKYLAVVDSGDRRNFVPDLPTGWLVHRGIARAQLPAVYLDARRPTQSPAPGRVTITCNTEAELIAAIYVGGATPVQPGDRIEVHPSVDLRTIGNLKTLFGDAVPGGNGVVWVVPIGWTKPYGVRVGDADAASLYKITVTQNGNAPVITAQPGCGGGWRFTGFDLRVDSSVVHCSRGIMLGNGNPGTMTPATIPYNFTFEQFRQDGHGACQTRRMIEPNAKAWQCIDFYTGDHVHTLLGGDGDSVAIGCWNTPGPFQLLNGKITGGSENLGFGGGKNEIGIMQSGLIMCNDLVKPPSWYEGHPTFDGIYRDLKNGFEAKLLKRSLLQGNRIRNLAPSNQTGFAQLIKNEHYGDPGLGHTSDFISRWNYMSNAPSGLNTRGTTGEGGLEIIVPTRRIVSYGDVWELGAQYFDDPAGTFFLPGQSEDVAIIHPTCINAGTMYYFVALEINATSEYSDGKTHRLVVVDGIAPVGTVLYKEGGQTEGTASLDHAVADGWTVDHMLHPGYSGVGEPPGNNYPADLAAVGFTDYAARNLALDSSTQIAEGTLPSPTPASYSPGDAWAANSWGDLSWAPGSWESPIFAPPIGVSSLRGALSTSPRFMGTLTTSPG